MPSPIVLAGTTTVAPLVTALTVSKRKKSPGRASVESTVSIIWTATTVQRSTTSACAGAPVAIDRITLQAANPPLSFTETEQGNWFVTRRTGANPATSYERWSHVLKAFILIAIFDSGASDVAETRSLDPDNATYTEMWPALDNQGRKRFDDQVSRTGNVVRSASHFYDEKGDVRIAETSCTKQL